MGETPIRRRGWRKQPERDGNMRLAPSYKHTSGAYVQFTNGRWFFYGTAYDQLAVNSLWREEGQERTFGSAVEAMIAFEQLMVEDNNNG